MRLHLIRPLVFFDLETTGVNISTDRIVEISLVKQYPDGCTESKTWRVKPVNVVLTAEGELLREEVVLIPASATQVHHITNEDVAHCKTFREIAPQVLDFIKDADLAGYNSNHFDVPMLQEELLRNGFAVDLRQEHHFVDAFVIFQKHTPRTLTAAYMHYCGKNLEDAHSANADTEATREVLLRQVEIHGDVPTTVTELEQYTCMQQTADLAGRLGYNERGEVVFNFGKHKGRSVREVFETEGSYYNWMMDGEFPLYTKQVISRIMDDIRQARKAERTASRAANGNLNVNNNVNFSDSVNNSDSSNAAAAPASQEQLNKLKQKYAKKKNDGQQSLFD